MEKEFCSHIQWVVQTIGMKIHFHSSWVLLSGLLVSVGQMELLLPYIPICDIEHTWRVNGPCLAEADLLESCGICLEKLGRIETYSSPASVFRAPCILLLLAARTSCFLTEATCNSGWKLALILLSTHPQMQNSPPLQSRAIITAAFLHSSIFLPLRCWYKIPYNV